MTRVLLLGGTGDALAIARALPATHVYSLAGLGRVPGDLACTVRVGGFGGIDGLVRYLRDEHITLVVDATHPYAAQMSRHAFDACALADVPLWAVRRPAWQPQAGDDWREASDWREIVECIAPFHRPLFTLGREALAHLHDIPASQHWTIRCLDAHPGNARASIVDARGPFDLAGERALFDAARIDVVVSKNSGGRATEAKLAVARERGIAVVMLTRPALPDADRIFDDAASARDALQHWLTRP
ncbi:MULTISPECIES: cobalt-precorrin-6A reductase [Caballeronia]|jgi:precorrin-6A/cobalt-precorrin-6A reductase|uniref:cobalt-precorrin-6A reductase n=1 Tax=Caballeronia TaxID=1827195 RepID=UPI00158F5561|nr:MULTISPECIES: cobalt-precorrin-6A reductase [Caballeronia]MCG7400029.1 cobalt-precorrin-6A reductase [Caballeronia zhejiangensis]MCI1043707.1 cobalt-precorrin-6A reductase [Caballeronia zhejiangensis]MDR5797626.1 cobalt-precorrin-6A reductase [Caballeronia sp. LZ008]